jgi:hypothetical protein
MELTLDDSRCDTIHAKARTHAHTHSSRSSLSFFPRNVYASLRKAAEFYSENKESVTQIPPTFSLLDEMLTALIVLLDSQCDAGLKFAAKNKDSIAKGANFGAKFL